MATATQNGTSTEKADAAEAWVEMFAEGWATRSTPTDSATTSIPGSTTRYG